MYAEELCFAPKYVRLKQLLDSGALGRPTLVKQSEKHDGPHAAHFWDVDALRRRRDDGHGLPRHRSSSAGCSAARAILVRLRPDGHARARRRRRAATTTRSSSSSSRAASVALAEESWTKLGGMDDRAEVHGSKGVAYADLLHGNSIETYSAAGYDYAVEKAGTTVGWSFTMYEENWNYGFPQEMAHFVDCVQNDRAAARHRRRRPGRPGGDLRRLRVGRHRPQGRAALRDATRRGRSTCGDLASGTSRVDAAALRPDTSGPDARRREIAFRKIHVAAVAGAPRTRVSFLASEPHAVYRRLHANVVPRQRRAARPGRQRRLPDRRAARRGPRELRHARRAARGRCSGA